MVDKIDSTYSFKISRILIEGKLQIVSIDAPSQLSPGTSFSIVVGIENRGGADTGFVWLKDADTGEYLLKDGKFSAPGYSSFTIKIDGLVMPNKDWNLIAEAGHVE